MKGNIAKGTRTRQELEDRNIWIHTFYTLTIICWLSSTILIPMQSEQTWGPSILHGRQDWPKTNINITSRVVSRPRESNAVNSLGKWNNDDFTISTLINKNSKWLQTQLKCRVKVKSNSILIGMLSSVHATKACLGGQQAKLL